jgi:hypothetical protein
MCMTRMVSIPLRRVEVERIEVEGVDRSNVRADDENANAAAAEAMSAERPTSRNNGYCSVFLFFLTMIDQTSVSTLARRSTIDE